MSTVLETSATDVESRYREAVLATADGKATAEAIQLAVESGRTSKDLAADIATLRQRREAAAVIETAGQLRADLAEAEAEAENAKAEFNATAEAAKREYEAKMADVSVRLAAARRTVTDCRARLPNLSAATILLHRTGDPGVEAEQQAETAKVEDLLARAARLEPEAVEAARKSVEAAREEVKSPVCRAGVSLAVAEANARAWLQQAERRLAEVAILQDAHVRRDEIRNAACQRIHEIGIRRLDPTCMRFSEPANRRP